MMICALCQQESNLCDSHIFPELLYRPLYDTKHRVVNFAPDGGNGFKMPYIQKGLREKLLCRNCESVLCQYERHFAEVIQHDPKYRLPTLLCEGIELPRLGGLDYTRFKLFCLSILWHLSVSKMSGLPKISLRHHEKKFSKMLLIGNAGGIFDYPFFCGPLLYDGKPMRAIFYHNTWKFRAIRLYSIVYAGCEWIYLVGSHLAPEIREFKDLFLKEDGEMLLLPPRNFEETPLCSEVRNRLRAARSSHPAPNRMWDMLPRVG